MKVSVVIPAYNEAKYISRTLEALLAQDYPEVEVIVVDNGSTDRTSTIASTYPVKVVYEANKGTQWARERGRKESTGDVIVNLDADCLPTKDWLTRGMSQFISSDISVLTGPYDYYDGGTFFRWFSLFSQKYVYSVIHSILHFTRKGGVIIEGNVFFRASVLEKVGGYNTLITFYGDGTDMAKRISPIGKMVFDKKLLMKTSARRFKSEGTFKISILYVYHFIKTCCKSIVSVSK